jgi:hypothetical protein
MILMTEGTVDTNADSSPGQMEEPIAFKALSAELTSTPADWRETTSRMQSMIDIAVFCCS